MLALSLVLGCGSGNHSKGIGPPPKNQSSVAPNNPQGQPNQMGGATGGPGGATSTPATPGGEVPPPGVSGDPGAAGGPSNPGMSGAIPGPPPGGAPPMGGPDAGENPAPGDGPGVTPAGPPPGGEPPAGPPPSGPPPTPRPDGTYLLKYNFRAGSVAKFRQEMIVDATLPMMAQDKPAKVNVQSTQQVKIAKASNDGFTVQTTVLDSKSTTTNVPEMVSKSLTESLAPAKGSVETTSYDIRGVTKKGEQKGPGSMLGFQGLVFPSKAVKVGETWMHSFNASDLTGGMGGPGLNKDIPVSITLVRVDNGRYGVFNISSKESEVTMEERGMKIAIKVQVSGTVRTDLSTGLLVQSSSVARSESTMNMGANGPAGSKPFKSTQIITTKVTRI